MLDNRKFYINGEWVDPITPNDLQVINPATEQPIAVISMGTAADIDRAVAAARKGFSSYSRISLDERIALLEKLLSIYTRRYDEMARTDEGNFPWHRKSPPDIARRARVRSMPAGVSPTGSRPRQFLTVSSRKKRPSGF